MKLFAPLLLFLATSTATAEQVRLHAYCSEAVTEKKPNAQYKKTVRACHEAGGSRSVRRRHQTCTLTSPNQIHNFDEACRSSGTEVCFYQKGDELPSGYPLPSCKDSEYCPLGNNKCGCLDSSNMPMSDLCIPPDPIKDIIIDFPSKEFFRSHPKSKIVTAMGYRLQEVRCNKYKEGPGPQWTEADRLSYQCWQRDHMKYTGAAADGYPGKESWDQLQVTEI